jgi:phage major head subunit gpT-like protein
MTGVLVIVALLGVWPFSSGKEYRMESSSMVPAATGTVKVEKDKDNGNTKLDIKVNHLAKPSSLSPPANNYIVWVRPRGGDAVKQGALGVDHDLKGELKVVTVSKEFDLFITAEQTEAVSQPSGPEVLKTHVSVS